MLFYNIPDFFKWQFYNGTLVACLKKNMGVSEFLVMMIVNTNELVITISAIPCKQTNTKKKAKSTLTVPVGNEANFSKNI